MLSQLQYSAVYTKEHKDTLQWMESHGIGCQVNQTEIRVRHSHGVPCAFASMVTVKLPCVTLHTNGFLSRAKHAQLAATMRVDCPEGTLKSYILWLSRLDYAELIERWYPLQEGTADQLCVKKWVCKKLHSRSKSKMIRKWFDELELYGVVTLGRPGSVSVKGEAWKVELFASRFNCLYFSSVKESNAELSH